MKMLCIIVLCSILIGCFGKVQWIERKGGDPEGSNWIPVCPFCNQVVDFETMQCVNPNCKRLLRWSDKIIYAEKLYPEEEFKNKEIKPSSESDQEDTELLIPKKTKDKDNKKTAPEKEPAKTEETKKAEESGKTEETKKTEEPGKTEESKNTEESKKTEVPKKTEESKKTEEPSKEENQKKSKDWEFKEEDWK